MIEVSNVSLSRSGSLTLDDVTLHIPSGGLTAIIGPNGAGKSTLMHVMSGLIQPSDGAVQVDGEDIHALPERSRALKLALLTQSPGAVPRLTVRELVEFGRWPHHRGRPKAEDREIVEQALEKFDLHSIENREVESLSGGQKQRAFVGMAYAQTTPWMFLDEPLAALDPKFARDIMERLAALIAENGGATSAVVVLHDLQIALRYADHFIYLKDGRVHWVGDREGMTSESLSALYDTPLRISEVDGQPVVVQA